MCEERRKHPKVFTADQFQLFCEEIELQMYPTHLNGGNILNNVFFCGSFHTLGSGSIARSSMNSFNAADAAGVYYGGVRSGHAAIAVGREPRVIARDRYILC